MNSTKNEPANIFPKQRKFDEHTSLFELNYHMKMPVSMSVVMFTCIFIITCN